MQNIVAVIVTYNRLSKLQYALECYDKQTIPFGTLIIVDNNSTDGTKDFLDKWRERPTGYGKHVIHLSKNVGGSGGFYAGEKYALTLNPDWIYIADDDAYPEEKMVEKFFAFYSNHSKEKIAAICTSVWDMTNSIMYGCRSHMEIKDHVFSLNPATPEEYNMPYFKFNCMSYVGGFIAVNALIKNGLVNKNFFIYQDDVEHSMRLNQYGTMYCVPDMRVIHDSVPETYMTKEQLSKILWKEYYAARNSAYMLLKHDFITGLRSVVNKLGNIRSHRSDSMSACDKMLIEGCKDACIGRLGLHRVYRPGLEVKNCMNLPYPKVLWKFLYCFFRLFNCK